MYNGYDNNNDEQEQTREKGFRSKSLSGPIHHHFSDDHNTLLFFCIVDVQKYKSSKTQNDKHTKIQKHAEMQQSEKGQNTKMIVTGLCILSY